MGNVKIASQAYVDRQIEGNKTKITSDGLYSGESAVDAVDVVPSMKYAKDTYRRKDDLAYDDTSLALKKEVVGLVEDSGMFVGAENFTSQVIETVGEALADDADLKKRIEEAIDNVAKNMSSIATKEDLKQYLPVDNVKGVQSVEANAVYTAAYINKQLAVIADNFSSIDEDMDNYRKNDDFKYDNNGVEETIAFQSYVDNKFKSGDKEKYALAGHDHGSKYPQASNIVDDNESEPLASFEGVKIPTVEKVSKMLAGYVNEEKVVGYTKGEGSPADSPEDEDISSGAYSLPTLKKVEKMITDSLSPGGGSTFVTTTTLTNTLDDPTTGYVKKASVVDYNKEEEASAGQVYSASSIKSILDKEFDELYEVVE